MRRLGLILLGLGIFLMVMGPMMRFYMYPRVGVAPKAQDTITSLVGRDATIFDIGTLKEIQTDLTTKVRTLGDVEAAEKYGKGVVVWVSSSSTKSSDGVVRSRDVERVAFDARTGEAVNCCGEFVSETEGEQTPIRHRGLNTKFPFNTQKQTYRFWDGSMAKALPIKFVKTGTVHGVKVYEFHQSIPKSKVGEMELPASLLGEPGTENLTGERMYSNNRTLWVEPNTGVIIKREEMQDNTIDYGGSPRITTTKVTTQYDAKTVKANADEYGTQGQLLFLLRAVLPWVSLGLGLLFLVVGFLLASRARPATHRE